ncbi:hypothetical protein FF38_09306 [Lucilia cuprina]|uniref:Uncharacterized protein n=1 Tax=Lucilia cuprina TaxID=7375 RepID=A0A0L0CFA9_LUCCU|nr:hypothetical protein FF38_09306 [Lucilia cuprina]
MAINFEEIPSEIEIPHEPTQQTKTVQQELNERQSLLNERSIKCKEIRPFFEKLQKPAPRFMYRYLCVCPRYNPQYVCKHTGNIIIDRDVLTPEEHIVYLATPKANFAAPRQMPRYFLRKSIIANCTARINRLAKPDLKQVTDTLNNFNHVISRRHRRSLKKRLEKSENVEYTTIQKALDWLGEEKRLRKVAKRKEKLRCKKLSRKIVTKQRQQIKKIVCILFEEMKDFLLNDQFIMDESSSLVMVILETLREFTDKEFYITSNLREYQKILAFNLAVWINKFISNLNIHVAEPPKPKDEMSAQQQQPTERQTQELSSFIPVGDYISPIVSEEELYEDEDDEDYYSYPQTTSDRGQYTNDTTDIKEELK